MAAFYKRSKGNAGLDGVQFQVGLSTVFLLNASRNFKGWRISTENEVAGKFDDLVIEFADGSAVLLQAKHKDCKRINKDQLLSDNSRNADFSLPKYFLSYQEIKSQFNVRNIIVCTNADVDKKKLGDILDSRRATADSILYHECETCSYVKFNENILPNLKKNSETYHDKNLQGKGIDKAVITDENIKDFLEKLQFFSGYPSKSNLDKVIDNLLSHVSKVWKGISTQEIYEKVEDWFKDERGEYLNETLANTMFCEIRSNKYRKTLEGYRVSFACTDFSFTEGKQMFYIDVDGRYFLQVLKIYHALQKKQTLYMSPDEDAEVHKLIIEAFDSSDYEFLVFVVIKNSKQRSASDVNSKIKDIFDVHSYKKVVIISNREYVQQIAHTDILELDGTVTWKTLSNQCRERLSCKKNITFQEINVSLKELLTTSVVEEYDKAANSKVLEKLVKDEKVQVGKRPADLDQNTARYYVSRKFEREIEETDEDLLISGQRKETIIEEEIFGVKEKAILISDGAGMGKSTVLTKLGTDIKEQNPLSWIFRIELNDYSRVLMDTMRKSKDTITLKELLNSNAATKLISELEEYLMYMSDRVVLMLDGFDEISPHYTKLILNLITQCYTSPNFTKIIVTTRPHASRDLERLLQVKPFVLQPFTREDQIAFLKSYWEHHLELNPVNKDRCGKYAEALINKMSSWMNAKNNFAAIPLQIKMLAEIFQENFKWNNDSTEWESCKEFLNGDRENPKLPERMKVLKLFDMFIDKKFDIFLDKANPSGTALINKLFGSRFKSYFENHQSIALRVVLGNEAFQNETITQLFSRYQYDKSIEAETLKIGVVQENNGDKEFVHRTFAEYFVAKSIIDISELRNLTFNQDVNFQIYFIDGILCNRGFVVIHTFLESILEDIVEALPPNIFENYQRSATGNPDTDTRRSQLIHMLAQEGCLSILRLILRCINYNITTEDRATESNNTLALLQSLIQKDGINIKDELGNTPLHYASREGHLDMVRYLVHGSSKEEDRGSIVSDVHVLANYIVDVNIVGSQGFTALHLAAQRGHADVVKFLELVGADINTINNEDYTPLHSAAVGDHLEVVKFLREKGLDADLRNDKGFTALTLASLRGNLDVVKYLVGSGADIKIKEENGFTALLSAAIRQNLDVVKYLQELGLDINEKNHTGLNVLLLTVLGGNLPGVKFLVARGADINSSENDGLTALHLACLKGNLDMVKYLVECHMNVNTPSDDGSTPLHSASKKGDLDVVKYLVENGALVNARDNKNYTPLHAASGTLECDGEVKGYTDRSKIAVVSEECHLDTVKFLVEKGAHVNARDEEGFTPLYLAAQCGHLDVLKFLVQQGADVGVTLIDGFTALHAAAVAGHLDTVRFLVDQHNISVNVSNQHGITPLHSAARFGHLEVVRFLVGQGAYVNSCNIGYFTPLHLAARWGHLDTIRTLIDHGADFTAENMNGLTPLHLACINGQLDTVKFFVEQRLVDVNASNRSGVTTLRLATQYGHLRMVEFLIQCGARVDGRHNVAVFLAAENGHLQVVRYLVDCGADVNYRRGDGCTALHVAARMGLIDVIKCLVELGARVSMRNKGGFTALHMAAQAGHLEVVKYILERSV